MPPQWAAPLGIIFTNAEAFDVATLIELTGAQITSDGYTRFILAAPPQELFHLYSTMASTSRRREAAEWLGDAFLNTLFSAAKPYGSTETWLEERKRRYIETNRDQYPVTIRCDDEVIKAFAQLYITPYMVNTEFVYRLLCFYKMMSHEARFQTLGWIAEQCRGAQAAATVAVAQAFTRHAGLIPSVISRSPSSPGDFTNWAENAMALCYDPLAGLRKLPKANKSYEPLAYIGTTLTITSGSPMSC